MPIVCGMALFGAVPEKVHAQINQTVITITGSVLGPTCVLSSVSQEILLPDVGTSSFTHVGQSVATGKTAQIVLTNCAVSTASRVTVSFTGPYVAGSPTHLTTSVTGLSLVLTSTLPGVTGDVAMNGSANNYNLQGATTTLPFSIRYVVDSLPITTGTLTARATFTVSYS
ncbi:fimbrial protein [Kerstersia sp.]|uniref:fimbrial protein n=1 Tax=Kerstersia sp. TaxID=1930783 RepID=UPI003F918B11